MAEKAAESGKKIKGKSSSMADGQPGPVKTSPTPTPNAQPNEGKKTKSQKKQEKQQAKGGNPNKDAGKAQEIKDDGEQKLKGDGEQKSKAQLKAERRAIQEAQRAAKETKKTEGTSSKPGGATPGTQQSTSVGGGSGKKEAAVKKDSGGDGQKPTPKSVKSLSTPSGKMVSGRRKKKALLSHSKTDKDLLDKYMKMDNSILNLGFQYFHHKIVGGNARCIALLTTLKEIIAKYKTPYEMLLSRDLEKNYLTPCISYLNYCRPLSTSMGNAIKYLKQQISQIPRGMNDDVAIQKLLDSIDDFINDNIIKAKEGVAFYANSKINDGDVILVYAASSLIAQVLKTANDNGKKFSVIVVEGRPRTEGKSMLRYLVRCGILCSYVYIGSASHAMSEATKVFLGASAMSAVGNMLSRTGNAMIAALGKAYNIPVLVCCETYKFTDKVQLESIDSKYHAPGKDLITIGHSEPIIPNHQEIGLNLVNLMYDVTPSRFITTLVTELGMLPCTSVPVVLRRQEDLASEYDSYT